MAKTGRRKGTSLQTKVILLTLACVLASSLAISVVFNLRMRDLAYRDAVNTMDRETQLIAAQFEAAYQSSTDDVLTLAGTPPIQGIIRTQGGAVDPLDNSRYEEWRQRLETIFTSLLVRRPSYFQIRYIGLADGAREIVRVERKGSEIVVVQPADLQPKGNEPYLHFAQEAPGQVYFSEITYNREQGVRDPRNILALRTITPVVTRSGEPFGILVINIDYSMLVERVFKTANPSSSAIFINENGDFMRYGGEEGSGRVHSAQDTDIQTPPEFKMVYGAEPPSGVIERAGAVSTYARRQVGSGENASSIAVVLNVPLDALWADLAKIRFDGLLLGAVLVFCALILSFVVARVLTRPLKVMTAAIVASGTRSASSGLPVERTDEIGDLARAFRRKEVQLADEERRSRIIIDHVVDGLTLINQDGVVEMFNPSCERMFGYDADEMVGKNITLLMREEEAVLHEKAMASFRAEEGGREIAFTREFIARRKNGEEFPIELSVNTVETDGKTKFSGVVRDISQRKEVERLKSEFVSTVSHELRTPLTSIRGALGLLSEMRQVKLPENAARMIEIALKNSDRLVNLVNDILDFEKLAVDKVQFHKTRVDLREEVRQAVALIQEYAAQFDVTVKCELPEELDPVYADPARLQQVLANLLSNAAKFSPQGDVVSINLEKAGDVARIYVIDNGPGIPRHFRDSIFTPFAQADGTNQRKVGGTGLGLHITKQLVERMGGVIDFHTQTGVGTTFWVDFPLVKENAGYIPVPRGDDKRLRALHVEDDLDFSSVIAERLKEDVYVRNVPTLKQAFQAVENDAFDLYIIDIGLPDGDGLQLLNVISKLHKPVIVITSAEEALPDPRVDLQIVKSRTPEDKFGDLILAALEKIQAAAAPPEKGSLAG